MSNKAPYQDKTNIAITTGTVTNKQKKNKTDSFEKISRSSASFPPSSASSLEFTETVP